MCSMIALFLYSRLSGICDNEFANSLARSTLSLRCPLSNLIPWIDFRPDLKNILINYGLLIGEMHR